MSEKRFVLKFDTQENEYFIRDNFEEEEELGSYTLKWGVRKLNEQQATINRLEEENKQLRQELNDCEKFRYTVFKRMGELNDERRTKRN